MQVRAYVVTVIDTDETAQTREIEEAAYDAADAIVQVGLRIGRSLRWDGQKMVPTARVYEVRPGGKGKGYGVAT